MHLCTYAQLRGRTLRGRREGRKRPDGKGVSAGVLRIHSLSLSSHKCGVPILTMRGLESHRQQRKLNSWFLLNLRAWRRQQTFQEQGCQR